MPLRGFLLLFADLYLLLHACCNIPWERQVLDVYRLSEMQLLLALDHVVQEV